MSYRDDMRYAEREARWTVLRFLPLYLLVVVALAAIGFALHSAGVFGRTVVERKVFEQSYQRSEALKSQLATDRAAMAEVERQLRNPNLGENTRHNLEAQLSAIRIRMATTEELQE